MKLQLETTIGSVLVESGGQYIEIYTAEESYLEGLINLWDYEKGEMIMNPTLSNVIREVLTTLRDYFDNFAIRNVEIMEAKVDELLEPDILEGLKQIGLDESKKEEDD